MSAEEARGVIAETDIAIVGMAAHLPGAPDIATYWANLAAGIESIRLLSDEELLAYGEAPDRLRKPNYVPAAAVLMSKRKGTTTSFPRKRQT